MTEENSSEVAIARIEATLKAITNQIDYSERSSAQLVKLVDERFSARFDHLERRLESMDASRETARVEQARQFDEVDRRIQEAATKAINHADSISAKAEARDAAIEVRISALEKFKFTVMGAIGLASAMTGAVVAIVMRAIA